MEDANVGEWDNDNKILKVKGDMEFDFSDTNMGTGIKLPLGSTIMVSGSHKITFDFNSATEYKFGISIEMSSSPIITGEKEGDTLELEVVVTVAADNCRLLQSNAPLTVSDCILKMSVKGDYSIQCVLGVSYGLDSSPYNLTIQNATVIINDSDTNGGHVTGQLIFSKIVMENNATLEAHAHNPCKILSSNSSVTFERKAEIPCRISTDNPDATYQQMKVFEGTDAEVLKSLQDTARAVFLGTPSDPPVTPVEDIGPLAVVLIVSSVVVVSIIGMAIIMIGGKR